MYQAYATQRPGRPRWALAATAVLLLLTFMMAYALTAYKMRRHAVELGQEIVFTEARIRVRMPIGWKDDLENMQRPEGAVAVFTEPTEPNHSGRRTIVLFRGRPAPLGLPASHLPNSIAQWLKALELRGQLRLHEPIWERIGALPGLSQIGVHGTVDLATGQHRIRHIIGRAAMAPGGQTVGLLMFSPSPTNRADLRLIDQISAHLHMTDIDIAEDPSAVMHNAGIEFPAPNGAIYLKETDPDLHRVRIMDGRDETAWFLDLYRIPLPDPQTPERVVTNATLNLLETTALPHPVQTLDKEVGRETRHLTFPLPDNPDGRMKLWCVRIDPYTGLVLKGRYEKEAENELRTLYRKIAARSVVENYADTVSADQQQARHHLRKISEQGLSTWWSDQENQPLVYVLGSPGFTLGQRIVLIGSQQREQAAWWEIVEQTVIDAGHRTSFQIRETWLVREDLSAHALKLQDPLVQYSEFLEPEQSELRSELVDADGTSDKRATRLQDTFGCEPVLLLAGGLLADDSPGKTALFTGKEIYSPYLSGWWMTAVGTRPLPVGRQQARAVRLQRDSSPEPIILYYNEANALLAVTFDNGMWQQRKDVIDGDRYFEQAVPEPR